MGTGAWLFIIGVIILLVIEIYKLGKRHLKDLKLIPGVTDAVVGFCEVRKEDVCLVECKDCLPDIMKPGRSCQHLNQHITMKEFDRRKKLFKEAKKKNGLTEEEKRKYQTQQDYQSTNVPEKIYKKSKNERGEY